MGQINSVLFLVIGGFFTSVLMLWVQMRIMDYMAIASIFYLFPFGIFFRAFEPTRKFGGTLMGIAMTFFLFYPIVIIFNEYVMTDQIESVTAETATALQNAEGNSAAGAGGPQAAKEAKDKHDEFKGGGVPNAADLSLSVSNGAIFVLKPVMLYVIAAVVLPVINFIILVEVARALTAQLGEEVDVSNLTRMI
jgi:hypothetical protein